MNGGGTNCSAPLRWLLDRHISADLVILISDNQSWVDARTHGATELMRLWETFRQHNRTAKLVCIDLQPLGSTQAAERQDVLNVGGFSDAVFEVVARFARDELGTDRWVGEIEAIKL
jgi:60 kDa SS-A/Ro ribonucleoprotein